jgi:hypothetical protein
MRLFSGLVLAGAMLVLPALSLGDAAAHAQEAAAAPKPITFDGDTALWTVTIKPDKTADFEQVIAKLREGLTKSEKPERKQQAAGWKVMKAAKAMPDGNAIYTHIIHPVVPGADYTVMTILYEAFPDPAERTNLYNLYRGAFAANLGAVPGTIVVDLSKAAQ